MLQTHSRKATFVIKIKPLFLWGAPSFFLSYLTTILAIYLGEKELAAFPFLTLSLSLCFGLPGSLLSLVGTFVFIFMKGASSFELLFGLTIALQGGLALLARSQYLSKLALLKEKQDLLLKESKEAFSKLEEEKRRLQEEIKKWMEEADLRVMEKESALKRLSLGEAEVRLFLTQKQKLIEDVREAQEELSLLKQERGVIDPKLEIEFSKIKGLYNQLREQFAEKTEALNLARKELFSIENQLLASIKEKELGESTHSEQMLSLVKEREELLSEIRELEELVSQILAR